MKKYWFILFAAIVVLAATEAFAFDGQRKGFILGGGIGGGFLSNKFSAGPFSTTEGEAVFASEFKIGYAPSNDFEIYYIGKGSWWGESDVALLIGLSAVGISKYLGTSSTGFFVTGGVGLSAIDAPFEEGAEADYGFGLFGGAGYEFARHWTLEADILYNHISESGIDLNSIGFRLSINGLAF